MKLYDIALAAKPLQKLIEQDLPLRQAYQLAMLATRLNPTLEFYGNQLMSGRPQAELNELDADTLPRAAAHHASTRPRYPAFRRGYQVP